MPRVGVDTSEIRSLAADMRAYPEELRRHTRPILDRSSLRVTRRHREEMRAHRYFRYAARAIGYDVHVGGFGDTGVYEAEIGPDKSRSGGAIANIAYFGTSRGGGTVPDPQIAAEAEFPAMVSALADMMEEVWPR